MKIIILLLFLVPTYLSVAQFFERVTDVSNPIVTTSMTANYSGAAWIDYNNDGLIDLFSSTSFLFKNLGSGSFESVETIIGESLTGQSNGVTWSDYDNDGDIDLFMTGGQSTLYENVGEDSFIKINSGQLEEDEDVRGWAASWGDYDADGFTDLVITHPAGFLGPNPTSNHLFNNNGGWLERNNSTPATTEIAPFTIASFTDYDLDGDLDLFVGSGPAGTVARDFMYRNSLSQAGIFEFEKIEDEPFATDFQDGQVWNFIDYDNDGDLDGFVTNYGGTRNKFYQNDNGIFSNISNELTIGGSKLANSWGDVDNDGDLDVVVTGDSDNDFYINNGDGSFTSIQNDIANLISVSAAFGDYDDDGDLDLFLSGGETALFNNTNSNENNWILINLEGTASNRSALGAKIKIRANIDGNDVWQMREISAQNSFNGHNSLRVHFGLKNAKLIDSLIILWPNSPRQVFANIDVNNIIDFTEPVPADFLRVNFKSETSLGFGLQEIQFNDLSFADPNNPIISWEWDFDNDGVIDATEQNPLWQYDSLGEYSVKLTVSNGSGNVERVKENYLKLIRTPGIPIITEITPNFTDTLIAKRTTIEFSAAAIDTSEYELSYTWNLNSSKVDFDSTYSYRASSFLPVPRIDSLIVFVSNGFNTTTHRWDINVDDLTDIDEEMNVPRDYHLNQNFPNPFNPSTIIKYELPKDSDVRLTIYDLLGKEVATLVNEQQHSGYYTVSFEGTSISNGVYFYKLQAGKFVSTRKMLMIK